MTKTPQKPRGNPGKDWAEKLRLQIWVARLLQMHWLSDDWMDQEFLPPARSLSSKRRRTFNRVRVHGHDPEPGSIQRYGYSIVDRINVHPLFRGSARWYRAPLHDLLIPPGLTADRTTSALEEHAARLGFFRATSNQAKIGRAFLRDDKAFQPFSQERHDKFTEFLRERAHIDDVSMLALMFQEAAARRSFESAIRLRADLWVASKKMCRTLALHEDYQELLHLLMTRRIEDDDWSPLVVDEETLHFNAEVESMVDYLINGAGKVMDVHVELSDLKLILRQERMRSWDSAPGNWTRISSGVQFILANIERFNEAANYYYFKRDVKCLDLGIYSRGKFRSQKPMKAPKRPAGLSNLLAGLKRRIDSE